MILQSQAGQTGATTVINDVVSNGTSGTGTLVFQNGLIAQLTNPNNTYSGGNKINGATLMASSDGNLGAATSAVTLTVGTATFTNTAGTFSSTGTFASGRTFNLNGTNATNVIDVTAGNTLTINGVVAGAGSLTKGTNAGTLALSNTNTYTGGTTINAGTVSISADANLGAQRGL